MDFDAKGDDAEANRQALLQVTADAHRQGTSNLVRLERSNVEGECEDAVAEKSDKGGEADVTLHTHGVEVSELAGGDGAGQRLHSRKGRHAQQDLHSGEGQGASHNAVGSNGLLTCSLANCKCIDSSTVNGTKVCWPSFRGRRGRRWRTQLESPGPLSANSTKRCISDDGREMGKPKITYLDRSKHHARKGEQETQVGESVLANRCQSSTNHDGNQRQVGHVLISATKDNAVDENREHGDGSSEDLVEWHGDHGTAW